MSAQGGGLCPFPVGELTTHGNADESWVWHEDSGTIILKGDDQDSNGQPILQGPWSTIDFSAQGIAGERWALDLSGDTIIVALRTSESINLQKVDALTGSFIGESYSVPGSSEGFFSGLQRYDHEKHCLAVKEFDLIRIHDSWTGNLVGTVELSSIPLEFDNVLDYAWDDTHAYVITNQQVSFNRLHKFNLSTGLWSTSIEIPFSKLSVSGFDENTGAIFLYSNATFTTYTKSLELIESIPVSSMHYNTQPSNSVRLKSLGDYTVGVYRRIEAFNYADESWVYPSGFTLVVIVNNNTLELESTCLLSTPNNQTGILFDILQINENTVGFISFEDIDWGGAWAITLGNQTVGCTDVSACNFSPTSQIDDGSCHYLELGDVSGEPYPEPFSTEVYTYPEVADNTFLWSINNGIIEEGQGTNEISVYWGMGFGGITLNVTDAEGCSGLTSFDVFMLPTDIEEVDLSSISISPNPASNLVQITGIDTEACEFLSVYDLHGRLIVRHDVSFEKVLLDISYLDTGCYLVQLSSGERQRLVVN
jgi:hypothetical protein